MHKLRSMQPEWFTKDIIQRFWLSIDKRSEHWLWTGTLNSDGYGKFFLVYEGRPIQLLAHRVSFYLALGQPANLVLHKNSCHNRRCIKPDCLYDGSSANNMQDALNLGTVVGENSNNKIRLSDLDSIKKFYNMGFPQHVIAKAYSLSQAEISRIVNGRRWAHAVRA